MAAIASGGEDGMERREFLKLLGLASATAAACDLRRTNEALVPYLTPPAEEQVPGLARQAASTCLECPVGCGVLATLREDRPVKLEGHPDNPLNQGALCLRGQIALNRLHHPERLLRPLRREADGTLLEVGWSTALAQIRAALATARQAGKANLLLAGATCGSLAELHEEVCQRLGIERLPALERFHHGALRRANLLVFGAERLPDYRVDQADLLVSFGADLVETFAHPVAFGRRLARLRQAGGQWWHLEPHLSLSGVAADRRLVLVPGSEPFVLGYLLGALALRQELPPAALTHVPLLSLDEVARRAGLTRDQLVGLAGALRASQRPLLIAGGVATATANGLATALCAALLQRGLGMAGQTLDFSRPLGDARLGTLLDAAGLVSRLRSGAVGVLLLTRVGDLGCVPGLREALGQADLSVALCDVPRGVEGCQLRLPAAHALESEGDWAGTAGLTTLLQPLGAPPAEARAEGDVLLGLAADERDWATYLRQRRGPAEQALRAAGWQDVAPPAFAPAPVDGYGVAQALRTLSHDIGLPGFELLIAPSLRCYDGRGEPLHLAHEIPEPLAAVSYGPWLGLAEEDAARLGLSDGDEVELRTSAGLLRVPARRQPLLPAGRLLLQVEACGAISLPIDNLSGEQLLHLPGASLAPLATRCPLPVLSGESQVEPGRRRHLLGPEPAQEHDQGLTRHPGHAGHGAGGSGPADLYPAHEHRLYRWGMVIDLDLCTGCSACVAACYVENNLPLTGRAEHLAGCELSWLRLQPYRDGERLRLQPRACQHCDHAPCESVCPVYATYHTREGLNAMVYNRCVGTRYCANNCPYKVRRFNWFEYERPAPLERMRNPAVSERPKGVMEKCSFCVQRIREAKQAARRQGRPVAAGEVTPACAQTCPTGAIRFGNLLDEHDPVTRLALDERAFRVLEELGTRPAVYYLAPRRRG